MKDQFDKIIDQKFGQGKQEEDKLTQILESLNQNMQIISKSLQRGVGGGGNSDNPQHGYQKNLKPEYDANGKRLPPAMVPLPNHLLPLSNQVDSDDMSSKDFLKKEMMKDQRRQHLAPLKRLKATQNQDKNMERNANDAKFLDVLFNDKISDDSDHQDKLREEKYDQMKERLEDDDTAKNNFFDNLSLPRYNGDEDPTQLKDQLLAAKDNEEDEKAKKEAEQKREEYMQKFQ